jgi:hypothetical protein
MLLKKIEILYNYLFILLYLMSEQPFEDIFEHVISNFREKQHHDLFPAHVPMATYASNCDVGLKMSSETLQVINAEIEVMKACRLVAESKSDIMLEEKARINITSLETSKQQVENRIKFLEGEKQRISSPKACWGDAIFKSTSE